MDSTDQELVTLPCHEKLAFDTQKAATAAATVAQYRYGTAAKTYKCRHCGLWHLATDYAR